MSGTKLLPLSMNFISIPLLLAQVAATSASGSLDNVEHVIIFMQENRAFDHYFGSLQGVRGFNDRITAPMASGFNSFHQPVDQSDLSQYMLPFHVDSHSTSAMCMDAPQMSYESDMRIWNDGKFDSWNTGRDPGTGMSYFMRDDLPYYYALYDSFAVGDQYFQSTFTATNPNRMFFFTGSNGLSIESDVDLESKGGDDHGDADDYIESHNKCVLDNTEPRPGYNWTTMGEILEDANVSWKVYQEIDNFDDNGFAWFNTFQKSRPGDALFDRGMKRVKNLVNELDKDMSEGSLPQVSWIIAPAHLAEHATHHPAAGEAFTSQILDVLQKHPEVYAKSVFILNYDEGGQFYDHHWSPTPPINDGGDNSGGQATMGSSGEINSEVKTEKPAPIGLGFRVPLLVVSPWTRGNIVVSEVLDHTSVIQFLEEKFKISCPNISPWRRSITGNLLSFFDFDAPDYSWPTLPDTSDYRKEAIEDCFLPYPEVPAVQSYPVQEEGTRISRALNYEFTVSDVVKTSVLEITIRNSGANGAAFTLFDVLHLGNVDVRSVRQYALEGGTDVVDSFPVTAEYHYLLLGPNGFAREFQSLSTGMCITALSMEALLSFDVASNSVVLRLENSGLEAVQVSLTKNAYAGYYPVSFGGSASATVAAGSSLTQAMNVSAAGHWYDFQLSVSGSDCYNRRYAGHMEVGKDSISDPVMGANSNTNTVNHPIAPLKYRKLIKSKGSNMTIAGQKDAVWVHDEEL